MALRVLFLTPWFPTRPGDREGNFIFDSIDALARRNIHCSVLVSRPWAPGVLRRWASSTRAEAPHVAAFGRIDQLREVVHFSVPRNRLRTVSDRLYDWRVMPELGRMAAECGADIIHVHTEQAAPPALAVGRSAGIPVLVTIHGIDTSKSGLQSPTLRRRLAPALDAADRVVLVGEPLRGFFRDYVGRDDHFRVVANGVAIAAADRSADILAPNAPVQFISVSNLSEGKGVDLAIEALAELDSRGLSEWRFAIVGDGSERRRLERLVNTLGLSGRVTFVGAVAPAKVARLLGEADVFVLPSYREAFGIAYLEAMAAGLLTVGVRGQGPSAFIADERTGLLVSPNDAHDLAGRLAGVFSDRERMRDIAAAGAARARSDFSWDRHAEELLKVYGELADVEAAR